VLARVVFYLNDNDNKILIIIIIIIRPHALIINQKKFFFLYSTLAAVLTYDYQRSLCKVRNRMFITTLVIHSSTVHDPSALEGDRHRLYICRAIRAGSVCCMAVLPVPE
jgi:hypothetical protein